MDKPALIDLSSVAGPNSGTDGNEDCNMVISLDKDLELGHIVIWRINRKIELLKQNIFGQQDSQHHRQQIRQQGQQKNMDCQQQTLDHSERDLHRCEWLLKEFEKGREATKKLRQKIVYRMLDNETYDLYVDWLLI